MGLISQTIIMKWNPSNRNYYELKGYKFTKWKDEFSVATNDLSQGCNVLIDVKCDNCSKIMKNYLYSNYKNTTDKYCAFYCKGCIRKLFGANVSRKNKLNNGKSFEQWCINNDRQDILERWDYKLNKYAPSEIVYTSTSKFYFKCPNGLHDSEKTIINSITNNSHSLDCRMCNSFAQWGINNLGEDFLEKYWDYDKNIINPWHIGYGSGKYIYIKCIYKEYHGSYKVKCNSFTSKIPKGCPYCSHWHGKVHYFDSLGAIYPEVLNIWSNKNIKSPFEYSIYSTKEVWWVCENNKHENYYRSINISTKCSFRCPCCSNESSESILQEKVRLYIENLNYIILHEHQCSIILTHPKNKRPLPFDNEIKELKLIIEVHGIQHYQSNRWNNLQAKQHNTTSEYELHMQQIRDRYKRIFAKKRGYFYLEIPYWVDDKEETWKKLINNKIQDITN